MISIDPINDQDEILAEANKVRPVTVETPANTDPLQQAITYGISQQGPGETPTPTIKVEPQLSYVPAHSTISIKARRDAPSTESNDKNLFSYRLPVFAYVLIWFYIVIAALSIVSVYSSVTSYNRVIEHYDKQIASYSDPTKDQQFYGGIADTIKEQKADYESQGKGNVLKSGIKLAVAISLIVLLFSGRRNLKVIAILIAFSAIGYEIYTIVDTFSAASKIGLSVDNLVWNYILTYPPYIFVLVATLVFFMTPRASQAYE